MVKKKKTSKGRASKRRQFGWFYPLLMAILVVLLCTLFVLIYNGNDQEKVAVDVLPVYEDVQAQTPQIALPKPHMEASPKAETVYRYPAVKQHGIALIIDDVGYDLPALKRILALQIPVAISIIPDAPYAKEAAEMAHQAGHIVMLHMPMEPANPHYRSRMDDSFLRGNMSESTIVAMLQRGLEKVPYVQGMNNHMGSYLTSMPKSMAWVMQFCRDHGLFFVDSKTSASSVASDIAKDYGLIWGSRRVFLDNSLKKEDLLQSWMSAEHYAKRNGGCILIAHPHSESVAFLEQHFAHAKEKSMRKVVALLHVPQTSYK